MCKAQSIGAPDDVLRPPWRWFTKIAPFNVQLDDQFLQSWQIEMDTGDTFRSYVLGVMSPARFLCATPVLHARVYFHWSLEL